MKPTEPAAMLSASLIAEVKALAREFETTTRALCECREQAIELGDEDAALRFTKRLESLHAAADALPSAVRAVAEQEFQR